MKLFATLFPKNNIYNIELLFYGFFKLDKISANDGRELKTEKNENFSNNSLIMDEGKRGDTEDNNSDDEYDEEIDDDADMNLNGSGLIGDPSSGDFSVSVVPISTSRPSQKSTL